MFINNLSGITTVFWQNWAKSMRNRMPGGWKGPSRYVLSCRIYGHGLDTHHLAVVVGGTETQFPSNHLRSLFGCNKRFQELICYDHGMIQTFHGLSLENMF